jgi:hypothetical protein
MEREDLESIPAKQLHEQAIGFAKANSDIDWLWSLLRAIPAAEGQVGDLEDSGMDVASTISAINGFARADRGLPEILQPRYIDYILEQQGQ